MDTAERYENTSIRGTVCKSEQEVNAFVREMSLTYSSFAVIVENAGLLHTAKEYMMLYPEIEKMTIQKIEIYRNGICAVFSDVETVYDANLCYRIRTGDSSVLSADEKKLYTYLTDIYEQTGAAEMSRAEAVKALHDFLVLQLKYDESYQDISHSPEGVMKNRIAVCDGYARTMRLLLLLAGIDSKIISGTAGGESHAWNLVKMEDGWYHLDVTWDDPIPDVEGKVSYLYFLKNDTYMAQTHAWKSEISCTSDAYSIYAYREVLCDSYDALQSVYEQQVETERYLVFCYPKGGYLTQDMIKEYVMNRLQMGITYFPEKETGEYLVLEIMNPLMQN